MIEAPKFTTDMEQQMLVFKAKIETAKREARPYSSREYLAIANEQALKALEGGNYGVGAVGVLRLDGEEKIIAGRNGIISLQDTSKHAEFDVIDAIESLSKGEEEYNDRVIVRRRAPHNRKEEIIYTSLEPCITCTGRICTHKPDTLFIGSADKDGGALLDGRKDKLPPVFRQQLDGTLGLREGEKPRPIRIVIPEKVDIKNMDYVPDNETQLAWELFFASKKALDDRMGDRGLAPDWTVIFKNPALR